MFCPRCAAQNLDDARYCRACGADISLVPQALTGEMQQRMAAVEEMDYGRGSRRRHRRSEPASIQHAVKKIFMGIAFVLIAASALIWAPAGHVWWFWMLIPAFALIGDGVGMYLRVKQEQQSLGAPGYVPPASVAPPPRASAIRPRRTGELAEPPASVTEGTTRHLNVPVERAPKDVQ